MRLLLDHLAAQRGHLFPWAAVAYGAGAGAYFALRAEPGPLAWAGLVALAAACLLAIRRLGERPAPLLAALALFAAGLLAAGAQSYLARAPVLGFHFYGPVEGRVVAVDRARSGRPRLTLDRVRLGGVDPDRTPSRVRVTLHGPQPLEGATPGARVAMTAHLSPPPGPAEPGGFDFRRKAWFERLGAVGYTRSPALRLSPARPGPALFVARLRQRIARAVSGRIGGEAGAFAAAVTTGDRSAISPDTLEALRASNLAHLLAISGLHMGLLAGFVFTALRYGLALLPGIALRWPVKKLAAGGALLAGAGYLVLSGGGVATLRAYAMVSVVLFAVLIDRRALTLHAVGAAALIVLTLRPESIAGPGFQMSFAATTALVAVFGWLRAWERWSIPAALRPAAAIVVSSAVAGAATAPFAAAHFNQIAHYGLLANLLSVPVMGLAVMPAAVLAALLSAVGLGGLGLWIMALGIRWILFVAHRVAELEGALGHVPTPPGAVLPLLAGGALIVVLWQGRFRFAGLPLLLASFLLWAQAERPALLISRSGGLGGVMTEAGRALNKPRGEGFVAGMWLENDGAPVSQEEAAARAGFEAVEGGSAVELGGRRIVLLAGKRGAARLDAHCRAGVLVILNREAAGQGGPCEIHDATRLEQTGSLAFTPLPGGGLRRVSAAERAGRRPWTVAPRRLAEPQ